MTAPVQSARLHALDQFRGFTVASMFAVNFLASLAAVHPLLRHHKTWCSVADLVMPMFLFAVGFSLRLSFGRHVERHGLALARRMAVKRAFALVLVGLVVHGIDGEFATYESLRQFGVEGFFTSFWRRSPFQALVHIGVTTLWILPVIHRGAGAQVAWAIAALVAHALALGIGWHEWLLANAVIDGGALGFLTWTTPAIAGSLACMRSQADGSERGRRPLLLAGVVAMLTGYALSCCTNGVVVAAPPFVPPWHARDMWTMSQQAASASYVVFGAGFSLCLFALFVHWVDVRGRQWGVCRTLGTNALAAYVLHGLVEDFVKPYAPDDSPLWWALLMFVIFFTITWALVRGLEKSGTYIRL